MKCGWWLYSLLLCTWPLVGLCGNVLTNGGFDDADAPLKGWLTDYAWTRNSHYVENASRVRVVGQEAGRSSVAALRAATDAGVKMESQLIAYVAGDRYRATLWIKGGNYRVYFSGYQWRPGLRPHDSPTHPEMRAAYRSRAVEGHSDGWQQITLEIPGVAATPTSLQHLQRVRFITLFIWFSERGFVDDVVVEKIAPSA